MIVELRDLRDMAVDELARRLGVSAKTAVAVKLLASAAPSNR